MNIRHVAVCGVSALLAPLVAFRVAGAADATSTPSAMAPAPSAAAPAPDSVRTPATLELDWLEREVIARNPSLAAARAAWREASASAAATGALADPMLDLNLAPRSLGSDAVDPAYRIGLEQPFPLFGQRGLARRAATAESRAAGYDYETARLDLLAEARADFYAYFRIGRAMRTNEELRTLLAQIHESALAKYAAGLVRQTDPLQAEVEQTMADHERVVLLRRRLEVTARLKALLHQPQESGLPPPPAELTVPDSPPTDEWLAAAMSEPWPEVRAADRRIEARRAALTLARRERWPEGQISVAFDRFWSEPELQPQLGLSINVPLDLARRSDTERAAGAALERAQRDREAARDRVDLALALAAAEYNESHHEVMLMDGQVLPANERALAAARAAYESNVGDFQTLLNTTRTLVQARLDREEAVANANAALAALKRALAVDTEPLTGKEKP